MHLYSAVKFVLSRKKMSITDLADKMGKNRKTLYSTLETGNPRMSTVKDVADALDMKVSELIALGED